jgi:hypothetical protein
MKQHSRNEWISLSRDVLIQYEWAVHEEQKTRMEMIFRSEASRIIRGTPHSWNATSTLGQCTVAEGGIRCRGLGSHL